MRLCGIDVEVKENSPTEWSPNAMGRSSSIYGRILIREDMSPSMKDSTLLHEVIHMILDTNGFSDFSNNEAAVSTLAVNLHSFMRDNPDKVIEIAQRG